MDVFDRVTVMDDFAKKLEGCEILDFVVDVGKKRIDAVIESEVLIDFSELSDFIVQAASVYGLENIEIKECTSDEFLDFCGKKLF